ncbi:MAG: hypothetical protein IJI07_07800 [Flexilinea sp.]|nr:hypothetical protein [Flexilinea sp.]
MIIFLLLAFLGFSVLPGSVSAAYRLEADYTTLDGDPYRITLDYGPDAGIPEGAVLQVREILKEEAAYDRYLSESAANLGISADGISFARFFDVEIMKDGEKLEPEAPVQVTIAYQDPLDLTLGEKLSIVHFADSGTEVISDVTMANGNKEIVYQQASFSVTGTLVENVSNPNQNGAEYVVIVYNPETQKYYSVQIDGSLEEVTREGNTFTITHPVVWTYISSHDGLGPDCYPEDDDYLGNEMYNLRIAWDARRYNENQLASAYAYRYITPFSTDGIDEEEKTSENPRRFESHAMKYDNALHYENNRLVGKTWVQGTGWVTTGYVGADFDSFILQGSVIL